MIYLIFQNISPLLLCLHGNLTGYNLHESHIFSSELVDISQSSFGCERCSSSGWFFYCQCLDVAPEGQKIFLSPWSLRSWPRNDCLHVNHFLSVFPGTQHALWTDFTFFFISKEFYAIKSQWLWFHLWYPLNSRSLLIFTFHRFSKTWMYGLLTPVTRLYSPAYRHLKGRKSYSSLFLSSNPGM